MQDPNSQIPDNSSNPPPSMNYMPPPNMQPQTNTMAIISLVCAILGLVGFLPIIGSIVGIILGKKAQTEIANSGGLQSGDQLAKGGVIVGWVGLGLAALAILCICAIFGLGIGGAIFEGSRR